MPCEYPLHLRLYATNLCCRNNSVGGAIEEEDEDDAVDGAMALMVFDA